jgi:hypothetical protein
MKIAQIGPFHEPVSLDSEGPAARMIALLASGLLQLGHDVTVFASGDSSTSGNVVPVAPRAMRSYPMPKRHLAEGLAMLALEKAFAVTPAFDVIHVHAGIAAFPLMRRSPIPIVATVYEALDAPEVLTLYRTFHELALIASSSTQIHQGPELNWQALIPLAESRNPEIERGLEAQTARAYETVYEWAILTRPTEVGRAADFGAVDRRHDRTRSIQMPAPMTPCVRAKDLQRLESGRSNVLR